MLSLQALLSLAVSLGLLTTSQAGPVWNPVVRTSLGEVSGNQGALARRFTLPYAKPPVGSLRFKHPESLDRFEGLYDGTQLPQVCTQVDPGNAPEPLGSEDCLYMNIYTPLNVPVDRKLPVFVWVHGGSFTSGGIAGIDGSKLASAQNMIVVTVQYRLGVFGWLKQPRLVLDGNDGLRDLIKALEVVKQDIGAFGGDPSLVTLAGQSSGAQMVNALLSTPSASSLFNRAILQSAPLDYAPQPAAVAQNVGFAFSKASKAHGRAVLLGKSAKELVAAQYNIAALAALNQLPGVPQAEPFNVVLDDKLVSGDGKSIVNSGKQVIYTTVKDEACVAVYTGTQVAQGALNVSSSDFEGLVGYSFPERAHPILDSKLYDPTPRDDEDAIAEKLVQLTTDFAWTCPTQRNALAAAGASTVYLAEFDLGVTAPLNAYVPLCSGKVGHEDDIAAVFNTPTAPHSSAQTALVNEVQARWGAFARTGSPNPSSSSYPTWPALSTSAGGLQVLRLGATSKGGSSIGTSQRTDACKLYSSI
ncbi:hypothetical protein JCM11491_006084 [Sporobolomyces phaffii]